MRLFWPSDNVNSNVQYGTQVIPFQRATNEAFQWPFAPPYVKYGPGHYNLKDVQNEFQNIALYGAEDVSPDLNSAYNILLYSLPLGLGASIAGFSYGISKGSLFKAVALGALGGAIPVGIAWKNLKRVVNRK